MSSKSFGEWYESQKTNPSLSPSNSSQNLWFSSIFKMNNDSDVESSGLLHKVKNVKSNISQAGETVKLVSMFGGLALLFFFLAYFIGIPTLVLRPAKFAISFTMGSFMTIAAVATLQGVNKFLGSIFQSQRIVNTVLYILSLCMTILFSLVKRNYIGTVVSSVFQMIMLGVFVIDAIPQGGVIVKVLKRAISSFSSFVYKLFRHYSCLLVIISSIELKMALISKKDFWFTVAMLYKMSKIPFVASPFYLGYVVFTSDIISYSRRLTPMAIIEVISIVMLLGIAVIEAYPKVMRMLLPKSYLKPNQAFVNQHRLLIVFLRYFYFYVTFFMLTKTNNHYMEYILFDVTTLFPSFPT